ncbi:hypothetical protein TL16_g02938 [Triparma laevis f. inornata]|uniref:Uncharacterized protein n=2 Tax=Triparma laevis TaxID=1534972 RepID=A0A9W7A2Z3_9STRA|nr:hypothetical protein TL16_g02938 [Triparma laevis f. inornata]GMH60415.1 hypothetical protein TrLO_g3819 [Triparma laevis f. longispina]
MMTLFSFLLIISVQLTLEHRTFRDFYNSPNGHEITRRLYTDSYIDNWKRVTSGDEVAIYNMHEDRNVMKTYYCKILGAEKLCKLRSDEPPSDSNIGHTTAYDSIAVAAYRQNMIPSGVDRKDTAKLVEGYFNSKGIEESDLPRTCFSPGELQDVLEITKYV